MFSQEAQWPSREVLLAATGYFSRFFLQRSGANIKPLKIDLTVDSLPTRVNLCNYSKEQQEFIAQFTKNLIRCDMAYSNPTASWASVPLLVRKPGPANFRFTVDLRPINKFTVKQQYPMPNLENELTKLNKASCFAKFDLSLGYWQIPLERSSQESQSFVIPDGIFTPKRVLHCTTNAVTNLQSWFQEIIQPSLKKNDLYWLDGVIMYGSSLTELIAVINISFAICSEHNMKLHPNKCVLYSTSIQWCGRVVSKDGVRFDPRLLDSLLKMEPPSIGIDLQ